MTSNLAYADRIGSVYSETIESYCADDNAYWPKEIKKTALACPVDAHKLMMIKVYGEAA
jgi:hypothetical protein